MPDLSGSADNLHGGSDDLWNSNGRGFVNPQGGKEDGAYRSKSDLWNALLRLDDQHPDDTPLVDLFLCTKTAGIGIRMTNQSPLPITLEEINRNLAGRFVLDPGQSEGDFTFWKRYLLPSEGECNLRAYANEEGQIWKVVSFAYSASELVSDRSNYAPLVALDALQLAVPSLIDSAGTYCWIYYSASNSDSFESRGVQIRFCQVNHDTPELTTRLATLLTVTSVTYID